MDFRELVRLATEPGPMQELALRALAEEFAADDRADYMGGRNETFNPEQFAETYMDALPQYGGVPVGDYDEVESRASRAAMDLQPMVDDYYDKPWHEDLGDYAGVASDYLTSREGVQDTAKMLTDTFAPAASQLDSWNWAQDNMRKYHELNRTDPLTALGYLPLAGAGYIGSIPGLSSIVSGGRKLGHGAQLAYEGLFAKGGRV